MSNNLRCFLDFSVEGAPLGRVVFELFTDRAPKAVENFKCLCTGERGANEAGIPLWYKGSVLHRVIAGFMVQGGDFTLRNGKGGQSIYGEPFEDEDLVHEIDAEGLLCMANKGKNTNSSQFFVSLRPCPHLKGKHVVFGRVVQGYEIITKISKMSVDDKDRPKELVTISNCGELVRVKKSRSVESPPISDDESVSSASISTRSRSSSPASPKESKRRHRHHSERRHHHRHRRHEHRKSRELHSSESLSEKEPKNLEEKAPAAVEPPLTEEEKERKDRDEKIRRQRLEEIKRRYQKSSIKESVTYKGRGAMRAPGQSNSRMHGW